MKFITTRTNIAFSRTVYVASVHDTEAEARAYMQRTASATRAAASHHAVEGNPAVGAMVEVALPVTPWRP